MRPKLSIRFDNPSPYSGHIEIDGKPIAVREVEFFARADSLVEVRLAFLPENIEVDVDARCLRLNGVQLPEDTGRALLEQLKGLYGER